MKQKQNLHRLGQMAGAVHTVADVRLRCDIDSRTGCWVWLGATSTKKGSKPLPVTWHDGGVVTVRSLVRELGGHPKMPRTWAACGNWLCCCPDHMGAGSVKQYGAWLRESGMWRGSTCKVDGCRANGRARSRLTVEQVRQVRAMRPKEAARMFGVTVQVASSIRLGKRRLDVPLQAAPQRLIAAPAHRRAVLPTATGQLEVVVPAGVKITRAPGYTHDPRYQVPPGARPFGAGFSAVGIGRDVTTGNGW
jgi:hypothetical protein